MQLAELQQLYNCRSVEAGEMDGTNLELQRQLELERASGQALLGMAVSRGMELRQARDQIEEMVSFISQTPAFHDFIVARQWIVDDHGQSVSTLDMVLAFLASRPEVPTPDRQPMTRLAAEVF